MPISSCFDVTRKQFLYLKASCSNRAHTCCPTSFPVFGAVYLELFIGHQFCFLIMPVNIFIRLPTIGLCKNVFQRIRRIVHLLTGRWGNGNNTGLRNLPLTSHSLWGCGKARHPLWASVFSSLV